ncbi:hypothetical protein KFE25_002110 [Diacronema lutheri]|uniref:Hexosyltransferase n=1 Tax=Diacronema lutheri TaxID=2081491 RepID=A0A8J5XTP6_DIALT|nr:hypothetical protein KFE25_002110 [Diacronema lutheri]
MASWRQTLTVSVASLVALSIAVVVVVRTCAAGSEPYDPRAWACAARTRPVPRAHDLPAAARSSPANSSTDALHMRARARSEASLTRAPVFRVADCFEEREPSGGPRDVCLVTSLSREYLDGHETFMRSFGALYRQPRELEGPLVLYVLEDGLSLAERSRVCALYPHTVLRPLAARVPPGIPLDRGAKWASNLRKLFALFELRARCAALVKIDTGDMLVLRDPSALLAFATNSTGHVLMARALVYAHNVNGGLAVFQRGTLTNATLDALVRVGRSRDNYREQWLLRKWLRGAGGGSVFHELPKRFNVEWSLWSDKVAGPDAQPRLQDTVLLHFVGDKPWRRRRKGRGALDALWWWHFGRARMVVVGAAPREAGTDEPWLLDQFEHSARLLAPAPTVEPNGSALSGKMQERARGGAERHADGRNASCELVAMAPQPLAVCLDAVRPLGLFSAGLTDAQSAVLARAWAAHIAALCTAARPCAAGGGGQPLLDVHVRTLESMRPLPPAKLRASLA